MTEAHRSHSTEGQLDPAELLTVPEVYRRLRMKRPVQRALRDGEIPVYQVGGWRRVRWADVVAWLETRRARPTPHAEQRVREVLDREARR